MNKIIECEGVVWNKESNNTVYYEVPKYLEKNISKGKFIHLITRSDDESFVVSYEICRIYGKTNDLEKEKIVKLKENEEMYMVYEDFVLTIPPKFIDNNKSVSGKVLRSNFDSLLKEIKHIMYKFAFEKTDRNRREYLKEMYQLSDYNKSSEDIKKVISMYNKSNLKLIHIINLYRTYNVLINLIDINSNIRECEKERMKEQYMIEFDIMASSIHKKGLIEFIGSRPFSLKLSSDGKNIVFGKYTNYEFSINFFSLWNILNRMLTVSFIPVILILLGNEKKIQIYVLLGLVYFITLILSDEKQVENIIVFMDRLKDNDEKLDSRFNLLIIGSNAVIVFIIISIQITNTPEIIDSVLKFTKYFIADLLISNIVFMMLIILVEVAIILIAIGTSKIFYMKKIYKFKMVLIFFAKFTFVVIGSIFIYDIYNLNELLSDTGENILIYPLVGYSCAILFASLSNDFNKMISTLKSKPF